MSAKGKRATSAGGSFEVTIEERFPATHALRFSGGDPEPLHGHDWCARVTVRADRLDGNGLAVDFQELRKALKEVLAPLHGRALNEDVLEFGAGGMNPSAENVALHIHRGLKARLGARLRVAAVSVEEEPGCWATFRPR